MTERSLTVIRRPVSRENVPGTATSPSSTATRVISPSMGARSTLSPARAGGEPRLGPGHRGLERGRVNPQEQIALLHEVAFPHAKLDDPPRDIGAHVHLGHRLDLPAGRNGGDEGPRRGCFETHFDALVTAA